MVTLVGVISADTGLNLPDYRAPSAHSKFSPRSPAVPGGDPWRPGDPPNLPAGTLCDPAPLPSTTTGLLRPGAPPVGRSSSTRRLPGWSVYNPGSVGTHGRSPCHAAWATSWQTLIRRDHLKADMIGPVPCFFERIGGEYRWQIVVRLDHPLEVVPTRSLRDGAWISTRSRCSRFAGAGVAYQQKWRS